MSVNAHENLVGPDAKAEGFVARWSRRKQLQGQGEVREENLSVGPENATREAETAAGEDAEQIVETLPAVESLQADSDFRPFVQAGVSEELHRLALQRLFRLPEFNLIDELDDYAEDLTAIEPLEQLITREMRRRLAGKPRGEGGQRTPAEAQQEAVASDPPPQAPGDEPVDGSGRSPIDGDGDIEQTRVGMQTQEPAETVAVEPAEDRHGA